MFTDFRIKTFILDWTPLTVVWLKCQIVGEEEWSDEWGQDGNIATVKEIRGGSELQG